MPSSNISAKGGRELKITPELIARGYAFAAEFHSTQLDRAGEPYIRHPIRVAFEIAHMRPEYELVGLFHDLVEERIARWTIFARRGAGQSPTAGLITRYEIHMQCDHDGPEVIY